MKQTKRQKQILEYFLYYKVKPRDIAKRLNISRQRVYELIRNSKKSGLFQKYQKTLTKTQCTQSYGNKIRLHGEEFNLKILRKGTYYDKLRQRSNKIIYKGHTVRLYNNSIEIYCAKDFSFWGLNSQDAERQSIDYWLPFFMLLENDLHISLVKDRYQNIRRVNAHFSNTDSGIAENVNKNKDKLRIKGRDGKTWVLIDNSWQIHETETPHPDTGKHDMEYIIEPLLNDIKDHFDTTGERVTFGKILHIIEKSNIENNRLQDVVKGHSAMLSGILLILNKLLGETKQNEPTNDSNEDYDYFG